MTNLKKIIEQKARELYPDPIRGIESSRVGPFTAGASFVTTDPLILQAILQPFAEWFSAQQIFQTPEGKWHKQYGIPRIVADSTEELIQKYFADNKQKEDARQ